MKIAVALNDEVAISRHFGRTSMFVVFEIDGEQIRGEETRTDISAAHADGYCEAEHGYHNHAHNHDEVIEALRDCQVVLCRGMGWRAAGELVRHGINPLVIEGELSPREAVEQYMAGTLKPAPGFCRCQK
jgi:nitrogen fixation protein NifB